MPSIASSSLAGLGGMGSPVPHKMNDLTVELNTASGRFFTGIATSIDVRTEDGSVHIGPNEESYLNMVHATKITLQTADGPCVFVLENAAAGLTRRTFSVLAESIRRVEPDAPAAPPA